MVITNQENIVLDIHNFVINIDDDINKQLSILKEERNIISYIKDKDSEYVDFMLRSGIMNKGSVEFTYYLNPDNSLTTKRTQYNYLFTSIKFRKRKNNIINKYLFSKITEEELFANLKTTILNHINSEIVKYKKVILNEKKFNLELLSDDLYKYMLSNNVILNILKSCGTTNSNSLFYQSNVNLLKKLNMDIPLIPYNPNVEKFFINTFKFKKRNIHSDIKETVIIDYYQLNDYNLTESKRKFFLDTKQRIFNHNGELNSIIDYPFYTLERHKENPILLNRLIFGLYFKLFSKQEIDYINNNYLFCYIAMIVDEEFFLLLLKKNDVCIADIKKEFSSYHLVQAENNEIYTYFLDEKYVFNYVFCDDIQIDSIIKVLRELCKYNVRILCYEENINNVKNYFSNSVFNDLDVLSKIVQEDVNILRDKILNNLEIKQIKAK